MIPAFFSIGSVEFYVLLVVVAAAIIALAIRPSGRGEARQYFAEGILMRGEESAEPELYVECLDNGDVAIRRTGLEGLWANGALSLVVTQIGFDLPIEERLTPGSPESGLEVDTAIFTIDILAPERYHVKYTGAADGRFIAFTLPVKPGLWLKKPLPVRS